jgi:outer membrane protein OmpU
MNNLKKIGVSALAGSLVAFSSATAGEMAVSGTAEVTFTSSDSGAVGVRAPSGSPIGFKNNLAFSGSGDVNGYAVSFGTAMNDAMSGVSSSLLTVDMGAMGLVGIDNGTGSFGIDTSDDSVLPTAYEEPSHGGGSASLGQSGSNNVLGYKNTFSGVSVNIEYNSDYTTGGQVGDGATSGVTANTAATTTVNEATESGIKGTSTNWVLSYAPIDGLVVGGGMGSTEGNIQTSGSPDAEESTAFATYATGPVSVGYFMNESQSNLVSAAGKASDGYSLAFAVNDNLSVSYASRDVEFQKTTHGNTDVTEDSTGLMASYTMGGASIRVANNEHENAGGTLNKTVETTEISLVLAF